MREILFRGKQTDTGEWMYGGLEYDMLDNAMICQKWIYGHKWFLITPETFGEYSGLKDKNGNRIFDLDIVKDHFGNIGTVIYSQHFLDWRIRLYIRGDNLEVVKSWIFDWVYPKMCLEIIGNIHDNPELLEVK
jgi:uncharacterized phage protein (TIGR01671 family)